MENNTSIFPQGEKTSNGLTSYQLVQITGQITSINYPEKTGDPTTFRINCRGVGKSFDVSYTGRTALRKDDTMYGLGHVGKDGVIYLSRPPFAQPPTDRQSVIQCFMRALRVGYGPAMALYRQTSKLAGSESAVIPYISDIAQQWDKTRSAELLFLFEGIEHEHSQKLLQWWHRERNLRRLYLFGLTKKEINSCRMTCDEIFEHCKDNPYTLPAIPIAKCDGIRDMLNKSKDDAERERGAIVRVIWKNLHESGWAGTPSKFLARQFPNIKSHVESLKKDYNLELELYTAYLKFPHKVETSIAEYVATMVKSDPITYTTPLDVPITLPNGKEIIRHSACYTRSMSEDQMKAIQGALDHTFSFISGGPGTGKCLAPHQEVLMFNGRIKKAADIKVGDLLMGPDSQPRKVLSTCCGDDEMYEIKPQVGRSFFCNKPHVLTLQRSNSDIYDIPLDEFMQLSQEEQSHSKLFHVGVDFSEQPIPFDVEEFGAFLKVKQRCIPEIYKINSRQIRSKLLSVLVSDNYLECNVEIYAHDVEFLALSLGLMTTNVRSEGISRVTILGSSELTQPFEIISLGKDRYVGFELDGDGRFLLGDFLVTHNTACISELIYNLELRGINYAVCAYTGKAVARVKEVTDKRNPATIHRLIANTRKNYLDKRSTKYEQEIPLTEYDHIIIDEVSMLDATTFFDLIEAYPNVKQYTLVGDVNQLPPIGWGTIYSELLKSETIPTYTLTTNFRVFTVSGERDGIVLNCNAIVKHDPEYPFEFTETSNFSIIDGPIERVYDIVNACYTSGIQAKDMVIVTPYNKWLDTLNQEFQKIYNDGARYKIDSRGVKWMINDRVMLTQNDQEIGVYNGEIGTVSDISDKALLVDFGKAGSHEFLLEPTHEARLNFEQGTSNRYYHQGKFNDEIFDGDEGDIDNERTVLKLIHGYAMTVDKSQGSEWDFVIFYISEFNTGNFLNKNRTVTAISRAKRCCWCIVPDKEIFAVAAVKPPSYRCENLSQRLSKLLPKIPVYNHRVFKVLYENNDEEDIRPQMEGGLPVLPSDHIMEEDYGFDYGDEEELMYDD